MNVIEEFLERRRPNLYGETLSRSLYQDVRLEVISHEWSDIGLRLQRLKECDELEQLYVTVIVEPTLNGYSVLEVVAVRVRRVVHKHSLAFR